MKLSDTRFIRIDGTHVELMATNDDEARTALAELRHKKKELLHWKRRLRRRRAALERTSRHIEEGGTSPHLSPLGYIGRALGAAVHWLSGWNPFPGGLGLPRSLAGVAQDLTTPSTRCSRTSRPRCCTSRGGLGECGYELTTHPGCCTIEQRSSPAGRNFRAAAPVHFPL